MASADPSQFGLLCLPSMHNIRPATPDDVPFMADMLYEAATISYVLRGVPRPTKEEALPPLSNERYLAAWGREGDAGVIAEDAGGEKLGAAWYRVFSLDERGNGVVAWPDTPEVAIGVAEDARGRGVGQGLLDALLAQARVAGFARLVLSVNPENPAQRLYRRCGFRDLPPGNPHAGTSILMAVEL
jgi:ribosomal protein S18 acetylase RimI-like enzyme